MNVREALVDLAIQEQVGPDRREAAARVGGLIQAARLLRFLELTVTEYDDAGRQLVEHARRQMAIAQSREPGPRDLEPDEVRALEDSEHFATVLHLRIETFYVFAKVLLDKLAQAIEAYFGQAQAASLDKHSKLLKNLNEYARQKDLSSPAGLSDRAVTLDRRIVAFRDYYVVHDQSTRSMRGTSFDGEGRTRMAAVRIYPSEHEIDAVAESEILHDLMPEIEEYVAEVCAFIEANRAKRR